MLVPAALAESGRRSALLAALEAILDGCPATVITCDVSGLEATLDTIDTLARLQLKARRRGRRLELWNLDNPLNELIAFVGLRDALPSSDLT
jgi:hypothetical protein